MMRNFVENCLLAYIRIEGRCLFEQILMTTHSGLLKQTMETIEEGDQTDQLRTPHFHCNYFLIFIVIMVLTA